MLNQVQLNPRITRIDQVAYHQAHDIITAAWSPLGSGSELREDPTLAAIAATHGKTPAQIILRWDTGAEERVDSDTVGH